MSFSFTRGRGYVASASVTTVRQTSRRVLFGLFDYFSSRRNVRLSFSHQSASHRSAPLRAVARRRDIPAGGTRVRGQYNCRRVQSVEILLSLGRRHDAQDAREMSVAAASPRRRSCVIQIPDRLRGSPNLRFLRFLESLTDDRRASSIGVLRTVPRHRRYSPRRSTRTDRCAVRNFGLPNVSVRQSLTGRSAHDMCSVSFVL